MTNAEINAAISAWFEPKPDPLDWVIIDQPIPSAKGFWLHTNSGYERGDVSVTIPLDYFHSEDANARLLEAMPSAALSRDPENKRWWCDPDTASVDAKSEPFHDRKQAVVMAFCRFAGIAHKRDGGEGA